MHSAAFVTWFGMEREACTLDERDVIWYSSSAQAERGHCRYCATQLFFRSPRWPGELHIALAAMRDDIALAPQSHVYAQDAVSWAQADDKLPRYATVPSEEPGSKA